jgi:hypothetical protein
VTALVFTQAACEGRTVRGAVAACLLIACLQRQAVADRVATEPPPASSYDPNATASDNGAYPGPSPWLDLSPTPLLSIREKPARGGAPIASALTLGAIYAGFMTWTYYAWYRVDTHPFRAGGDGLFSPNTYAGGADKMGHAWATLGLGRWGVEMLNQWGGYDRTTSAIVGMGLSQLLFLGVEIKDGFAYQFSYGDFAFNTAGALLGFAQSIWPSVDRAVDFRVEYWPSAAYRARAKANGDIDWAEDYSGQTYQLAFHLSAIPGIERNRTTAFASQFVDVWLGFRTRGYKPDPLGKITEENPDFPKEQSWIVGVGINMQGVFDYLWRSGNHETVRKIFHAGTEMFGVPYTSLPIVDYTRTPTGPVPDEQ